MLDALRQVKVYGAGNLGVEVLQHAGGGLGDRYAVAVEILDSGLFILVGNQHRPGLLHRIGPGGVGLEDLGDGLVESGAGDEDVAHHARDPLRHDGQVGDFLPHVQQQHRAFLFLGRYALVKGLERERIHVDDEGVQAGPRNDIQLVLHGLALGGHQHGVYLGVAVLGGFVEDAVGQVDVFDVEGDERLGLHADGEVEFFFRELVQLDVAHDHGVPGDGGYGVLGLHVLFLEVGLDLLGDYGLLFLGRGVRLDGERDIAPILEGQDLLNFAEPDDLYGVVADVDAYDVFRRKYIFQ